MNKYGCLFLSLLAFAILSPAAGCKDSGHSLGSSKDRDASGTETPAQTGGTTGSGGASASSAGNSSSVASAGATASDSRGSGGSGGVLGGSGGQTSASSTRDAGMDSNTTARSCVMRDESCESVSCCTPYICLKSRTPPICGESYRPPPDSGTAAPDSRVALDGADAGDYLDSTGRCLTSLTPAVHGCPATYNEALRRQDSCGTACAGPTDELLIYMDYCTPSHGCAYAVDSKLLVGYQLMHDTPDFCGGKSVYAYSGQFPALFIFNSLDLDEKCPAL